MKKIFLFIITLSILFCNTAFGEETFLDKHEISIGYNFLTYHLRDRNRDVMNEQNNGIFVSIDGWTGIEFETTKNKQGIFLGKNLYRTDKWLPFDNDMYGRLNLYGGALYGYDHRDKYPTVKGWGPFAFPSVETGYNKNIAIETVLGPTLIISAIKITF